MKKVVKFGGSSLASARQFKKVKAIIDADKTRCYVVPSAPGKRDSKDTKVTDMLYQCYDAVCAGQSYKRILDQIRKRYTIHSAGSVLWEEDIHRVRHRYILYHYAP